jgi:hypothetical protein
MLLHCDKAAGCYAGVAFGGCFEPNLIPLDISVSSCGRVAGKFDPPVALANFDVTPNHRSGLARAWVETFY